MPNFTSNPVVLGSTAFTSSANAVAKPGQQAITADGRKFRYAQAGSANLAQGTLIQSAALVANHKNCGVPATAIGANTIQVTLGATAATLNQYADGVALVSNTPGAGYQYTVKTHPAADASANLVVTLTPSDAVQVALTTDSKVDLVANPYRGVIKSPTTKTGAAVGAAVYPVLAGEYGWIQTGGVASLLIDGAPAAGAPVMGSGVVAGAVAVASANATVQTGEVVGRMVDTGVDTKHKAVFLTIE